jgi:type III pantothenate kinase
MSNFDSQKSESTLFVDIGNSSVKIGFVSDGKWTVHTHRTALDAAKEINNHMYPLKHVVLSSVRENLRDTLEREIEASLVREITIKDVDADKLDYTTPETLGIDRYLGCLGAKAISRKGVVVIDGGSACTIDYMSKDGVYHGGVIMPGFRAIMNIFKDVAPELPEVKVQIPEIFPGKSTTESLQWGQVGFFVDGVISILQAYDKKFEDFELYVTGGDAELLNTLLGNVGEVNPRLVLEGLKAMVSD